MEVDPNLLVFDLSLKHPKAHIFIKNNFDSPLAFKVKTKCFDSFIVRPSAGILKPGESSKIIILYQLDKDEIFDLKRKDKFVVQGLKIPDDITSASMIEILWKNNVEIIEKKLRCTYIIDDDPYSSWTEVFKRKYSYIFIGPIIGPTRLFLNRRKNFIRFFYNSAKWNFND